MYVHKRLKTVINPVKYNYYTNMTFFSTYNIITT